MDIDKVVVQKDMVKTKGHIVIIEWDGKIPPTPYYHRLRKLTSGVRGDSEKSVIARRAANVGDDEMAGLTLQEGAVITPSRTLARAVAGLAKRYGAPSVHIGEVSLSNYTQITYEDEQALERVDKAYGQRGRPRMARGWQVSCAECLNTYFVEEASYVPNCPNCGGFIIVTYPVRRPTVYPPWEKDRATISVMDEWVIACFGSGRFMVPFDEEDYHDNPEIGIFYSRKKLSAIRIADLQEQELVDKIKSSDYVQYLIDTQPKETAMNIMTGIFASRRFYNEEERQSARIKTIMSIMADGFKGSIRMSESPDQIDLLDASRVFSADYLKGLFYSTLPV